jgi:hypothetical protein
MQNPKEVTGKIPVQFIAHVRTFNSFEFSAISAPPR